MIRMVPIQNNHRLQISLDSAVDVDGEALDAIIEGLALSPIAERDALLRQIEEQMASPCSLITISIGIAAATHLEQRIRSSVEIDPIDGDLVYNTDGEIELHDGLRRAMGLPEFAPEPAYALA